MRRIGILVVIVAAGLGLVACGSDSEDESGELSSSEFASKANDVCAGITKKVDDALKNVNPGVPTGSESAQAIADVARLDRQQLSAVDGFVPPQSEQDDVTQLLDKWRERADLEEQISEGVTAGDDAATLEGLNDQLEQLHDEANDLARGLGLDECRAAGLDARPGVGAHRPRAPGSRGLPGRRER